MNIRSGSLKVIVIIIAAILLLSGCSLQKQGDVTKSYVDVSAVESISKHRTLNDGIGGRFIDAKTDTETVKEVIEYMNSCKKRREATDKDIEFLKHRHGHPNYIEIKMNDGSKYYATFAWNITVRKDSSTISRAYQDRFLLTYVSSDDNKINKDTKYYIVYSKRFFKYILDETSIHIPK